MMMVITTMKLITDYDSDDCASKNGDGDDNDVKIMMMAMGRQPR